MAILQSTAYTYLKGRCVARHEIPLAKTLPLTCALTTVNMCNLKIPESSFLPLNKIQFNGLNNLSKEKTRKNIFACLLVRVATLQHSIKSELWLDAAVSSLSQTMRDDSSVAVLFKCQAVLFKSFFTFAQLVGKQLNILIHSGVCYKDARGYLAMTED